MLFTRPGGDPLLIGYEKMTLCFGHACGIKVSDLIDDNDWRTLYRGLRKKGKSKPRRDLTRIKIHPI